MQADCRTGGASCGSQGPQASGREWRLRFHKKHGFLDQNCVTKPSASLQETGFFWSCNEGMCMMQTQCRIGGAYCPSQGHPASGSAKIWMCTILHCFVAFVTWKHGADFCKMPRCHNKWPWRPQTKKSIRNFTVTGMSCLDRARTANVGYRKFTTKSQSNPSLIHNSNIEPDVRAGLWLPTQ